MVLGRKQRVVSCIIQDLYLNYPLVDERLFIRIHPLTSLSQKATTDTLTIAGYDKLTSTTVTVTDCLSLLRLTFGPKSFVCLTHLAERGRREPNLPLIRWPRK